MSKLIKSRTYDVIPGTPGTAGIPGVDGIPGTPARTVRTSHTGSSCRPNPACNTSQPNVTTTPGVGDSIGSSGYTSGCSPAQICNIVTSYSSETISAVPGSPGTSGTPGTSATPAQLIEHLHEGWNSWSMSVDEFEKGKCISYTVNEGVEGVLLSIGVNGKIGNKINTFSHSILVEPGGIMVFEDGVNIDTIKFSYESTTDIRMYRQPDNNVVCVIVSGTETIIHEFVNPSHALKSVPLYAYAYMYIADDALNDASFNDGQVHFGEA